MDTPQFTKDHLAMISHTERRVSCIEKRLRLLDEFKVSCDKLHADGELKQRGYEDATNRNTESTLLLAKAVADINCTITKLLQSDDEARPVIKFYEHAEKAWTFNKAVWSIVIALAAGALTIISIFKVL